MDDKHIKVFTMDKYANCNILAEAITMLKLDVYTYI